MKIYWSNHLNDYVFTNISSGYPNFKYRFFSGEMGDYWITISEIYFEELELLVELD